MACVDIDIEKAKKKIEISTNTSVQNLKDKVFKSITEAKKNMMPKFVLFLYHLKNIQNL